MSLYDAVRSPYAFLDGRNVVWCAVDWAGLALSPENFTAGAPKPGFSPPVHHRFLHRSLASFCDVTSSFTTSGTEKVGDGRGPFLTMKTTAKNLEKNSELLTMRRIRT